MNKIVVTAEEPGGMDVMDMISSTVARLEEARLLSFEKYPWCNCGKDATTLVIRIGRMPFEEWLACEEHARSPEEG